MFDSVCRWHPGVKFKSYQRSCKKNSSDSAMSLTMVGLTSWSNWHSGVCKYKNSSWEITSKLWASSWRWSRQWIKVPNELLSWKNIIKNCPNFLLFFYYIRVYHINSGVSVTSNQTPQFQWYRRVWLSDVIDTAKFLHMQIFPWNGSHLQK